MDYNLVPYIVGAVCGIVIFVLALRSMFSRGCEDFMDGVFFFYISAAVGALSFGTGFGLAYAAIYGI